MISQSCTSNFILEGQFLHVPNYAIFLQKKQLTLKLNLTSIHACDSFCCLVWWDPCWWWSVCTFFFGAKARTWCRIVPLSTSKELKKPRNRNHKYNLYYNFLWFTYGATQWIKWQYFMFISSHNFKHVSILHLFSYFK